MSTTTSKSGIRYDKHGLLVGEPLSGRRNDSGAPDLVLLRQIRDGVLSLEQALLKAMEAKGAAGVPSRRKAESGAPVLSGSVATPRRSAPARDAAMPQVRRPERARDAIGRFIASKPGDAGVPRGNREQEREVRKGAESVAQSRQTAKFLASLGIAGEAKSAGAKQAQRERSAAREEAVRQAARDRDTGGRFTAGGVPSSGAAISDAASDLRDAASNMSGAASHVAGQVERMDPVATSIREVADTASTGLSAVAATYKAAKMVGGVGAAALGAVFGSPKQVGAASEPAVATRRQPQQRSGILLGRLFRAIVTGQRAQAVAVAVTNKRLREIADKPEEGGGKGSILSRMIAPLVAGLVALLKFLRPSSLVKTLAGPLISAGMGVAAAGAGLVRRLFGGKGAQVVQAPGAATGAAKAGLLSRGAAKVRGWFGAPEAGAAAGAAQPAAGAAKPGRLAKLGGMMKRIPLLGALLTAGMMVPSISQASSDDPDERAEGRRGVAGGIGSLVGGLAGGLLGSVAGPAGTLVGGVAGAMIGEKAGEKFSGWVDEMVAAGLPARLSTMADTAAAALGSLATTIKGGARAAYEAVKPAIDAAKNSAPVKAISGAASAAVDAAKNSTIGKWVLGLVSSKHESGRMGAAAVSTGAGDAGGASYGTFQLSSTRGSVQDFLSKSTYGAKFSGLKAGSKEFGARWQEVAKSDPGFAQAQRDYIKATHYDPMMSGLKGAGIDLSGRGKAVQESVFSTSVQFGSKGGRKLFGAALAGKNLGLMSDAEIITAVQDYKAANNARLFASSSAAVRKGTLDRASREKSELLGIAASEAAPAAAAGARPILAATGSREASTLAARPAIVGASAPAIGVSGPKVEPLSVAPTKVPDQPRDALQITPVGTRKPAPIEAYVRQPIRQDVPDRTIAHVATGGIGQGGW